MEQLDRHVTEWALAGALVRALPDAAVIVLDREQRVTWADGAPLERVSWREGEVVGRRLSDLLPRTIHARVASGWRTALSGERAELQLTSRRSGRRHAVVFEPLRAETGEPVAVLALLRDPDRARVSGPPADGPFDLVFDSSPIGMALLSLSGRCVRTNQALVDLLGYSELELLARSFDDVLHADDVSETRGRAHALLSGEIAEDAGERRLRHADGAVVHVGARVTLTRDPDGRPRHFVVQLQDASERRHYEYRLQELADYDPLTGLPNRAHFERELERGVAAWRAGSEPAVLLLLDLDHFKYVNDAHGHRTGDELLLRVACRLRTELPAGALIARIGGDELAALVPRAGPEEAGPLARRLVAGVRSERLAVGAETLGATASVGVAQMGDATADGEALLVAADLAMHEAKALGGDRVVLHDPAGGGRERASAGLRWSQRIRAAVEEERLELHAQPIVDAFTGVPVKYELLVRLRDEDGALVGPGDFLPHAERFGLVGIIDRWVVGKAVALAAEWDVILALNLSGRSVGDPALLGFVEGAIAAAGLDPSRLVFEITETAAIASMPDAQCLASGLRRLGCRFTLDDFGAGFASFSYVKQLPFDYLKIDGSFVRDLPSSPTDRLVVSALVEVARGLGKQTVAEFVCSPAVLAEVRSCGVDLVQGHHVGAPAPLAAWLAASVASAA